MFIINYFPSMVFVFSISLTWNPHGLFMLFCLPKADGGFTRIFLINHSHNQCCN